MPNGVGLGAGPSCGHGYLRKQPIEVQAGVEGNQFLHKRAQRCIFLFNFLSFWNEYIIAMTLLSDPNGAKTLPVGLMQLTQAQQSAAQYGQLYAGLVLVMLPTLILYICVQRKLTQGMTLGGLKG